MNTHPDIQALFPDRVKACAGRIGDRDYELYPEERVNIQKAVSKRQREFAAGRDCARRALGCLGIDPCALPRLPNGAAGWPEGTVGSISHSLSWCGAAVASLEAVRGIGFDIETVDRVTDRIEKMILTGREKRRLDGLTDADRQAVSALIFSAKESVYKCLQPLLKDRIGFQDAVVTPSPDRKSFRVEIKKNLSSQIPAYRPPTGSCFYYDGDIFTGLVLLA